VIPVLEIGGTHATSALVDPALRFVAADRTRRVDLDASGSAEAIFGTIVSCGRSLGAAAGLTWGVAIPGPFDYERGIGRYEGVAKFDALNGADVRAALVEGLDAGDVAFVNDADAFLLGEWEAGAARGHQRAVGLTLGTGIGSAFLSDGAIVDHGPDVPPGGRAHLLTIGDRPLEETVSRRAMLARYRERASNALKADATVDIHDLADRARSGDMLARDIFREAMTALGAAMAPWIARFRASILVVGGSMTRSWDLIEAPLRSPIDPGVEVVVAARPDEAALIGAARCATDRQQRAGTGHTGPDR
jgi:glucokinase